MAATGFQLDLFDGRISMSRCPQPPLPQILSVLDAAATFFELQECSSKNVPDGMGTTYLSRCVQRKCVKDGAHHDAKNSVHLVRNRCGQCAKAMATASRERCEQHVAVSCGPQLIPWSYQSLTATRVAPPCCVTLGLHRSLTAPLENDSSVALLDHT